MGVYYSCTSERCASNTSDGSDMGTIQGLYTTSIILHLFAAVASCIMIPVKAVSPCVVGTWFVTSILWFSTACYWWGLTRANTDQYPANFGAIVLWINWILCMICTGVSVLYVMSDKQAKGGGHSDG